MKTHKEAKHEGIRYPCDQCDYSFTAVSILNKHKKSKHKGIRYLCDQCEYTASDLGNLKRHKRSEHEGIRYPCDQCEYAAIRHLNLKYHKNAKHSDETVMDNIKHNIPIILRRKVNVRIEKLYYDKYMRIQNKVNTGDFVPRKHLNRKTLNLYFLI